MGHIVFGIKMGEKFRRNARYCANGHNTESPEALIYNTVVSRDSVRIILTTAAMNGLETMGADAQNAFMKDPCKY